MSIAFQCREVATGPVVGYQVGAQGDGSGYIRQQQQQHQQTQDAMIRGLSCISIYVQSNPDGVPGQKGTDGSSLRPFGGGQEVFKAVGQDHQVGFQPALAVLDFPTDKDFDCNFRVECNSSSQHGNHERSAEGPLEYLGNFGDHKESASVSSNSITDDNCSSSSIGDDDDEDTSGDMEVESKLKGPLDSMAELEDSLPIKRGLSNFFTGKSKSFTCLSDVVSVKDLAKPENPYNKRRRNLLAYGNSWERNRFHPPRNSSAGISKKAMHTSKSTLALAVAMSKSEDSSEKDENDAHLPPLPPQGKWQRSFASPRSFSLTDLQGV